MTDYLQLQLPSTSIILHLSLPSTFCYPSSPAPSNLCSSNFRYYTPPATLHLQLPSASGHLPIPATPPLVLHICQPATSSPATLQFHLSTTFSYFSHLPSMTILWIPFILLRFPLLIFSSPSPSHPDTNPLPSPPDPG